MSLFDFFRNRGDGRAMPATPARVVDNPPPARGAAKLALVVGAAAAGLIAVVGGSEGKRNNPYRDLVGVWTVCYGETNVPMRRYTDTECKDMLAESLVTYAEPVLARNPELKGHDAQVIAATSLAYNIGVGPADLRRCGKPGVKGGYRCSAVARKFSAGDWKGACNAMLAYNKGRVNGVLVPIKGLTTRRAKERAICLRGL